MRHVALAHRSAACCCRLAIPEIFTGIRIGFSLTLIGTLLGEMFASQRGLGFLLIQAIGLHNIRLIMALTLLLVVHRRDGERCAVGGRPAAAPPDPCRRLKLPVTMFYATAASPRRTVWRTSKPSNCG